MEQVTDLIGNPTALLIERIFWLGLGGFLGLAIITSQIRGSNESRKNRNHVSSKELEHPSNKTIQQNSETD
tara:strand:- start:81 stop:293 length:213 start_codon:yes stop_codon:yes gene_type:complete